MPNWYTDGVITPVQERLDKISVLCQGNSTVQILIDEIITILDSAGTERPNNSGVL